LNAGRAAWVVGAYLVGTLPFAYVVARGGGHAEALASARGDSSAGDAHVVLDREMGRAAAVLAAVLDVLKGFLYALAARLAGDLPASWLAGVGVALVAGHCFPFYLRRLAGRGLSCASGVMLALVPLAMVVAGAVIVVGYVMGSTGVASTIGLAAAPAVAALLGQRVPIVAMTAGIFALVLLRRLAGASAPARDMGWRRAILGRAVFDEDRPDVP
jgi:glycerol-3-phosphate acyltransferase PlsY